MKIIIDIGHPAHVHFFKIPAKSLVEKGHKIIVTSRNKDVAIPLLGDLGLPNIVLSSSSTGSLLSLGKELISRNYALYKLVKKEKPDLMVAIGGTFIAHVGMLTNTPSLVFYDTENAKLQNMITYPFATKVIVPNCYTGWIPKKKEKRYPGYHELAYLHPSHFKVNPKRAIENGIDVKRDNFFLRIVSWQANHDIGEDHWSMPQLIELVKWLSTFGKVIISSERKLPEELSEHQYQGKLSEIHHVLGMSRMFIGESATMASEAAVMGVPAIYAAETGRGYTDEQEKRYGLVRNLKKLDPEKLKKLILSILDSPKEQFQQAQQQLIENTINVADYVADQVINYTSQPNATPMLCGEK